VVEAQQQKGEGFRRILALYYRRCGREKTGGGSATITALELDPKRGQKSSAVGKGAIRDG